MACPASATRKKCFAIYGQIKNDEPYILMVEGKHLDHPKLEADVRSRMKIFRVNPNKDLAIKTIKSILQAAIDLYKRIKIKL